MSIGRKAALMAALVMAISPSVALAGDREDARLAITAAQAKIETNDKAGVDRMAPEAQARARAALMEAQRQFDRHHEDRARDAANNASSLADLALATAQAHHAEAERAAALAAPQE